VKGGAADAIASALRALVGVSAGLLALNLVVWGYGEAPLAVLARAAAGTWGNPYGIGQIVYRATTFVLTGIGADLALRVGRFNVGGEGQMAFAGLALGVLASHLSSAVPGVVTLPLAFVLAAAVGMAWMAVPTWLHLRRGVHEVVGTVVGNAAAAPIVTGLMSTFFAVRGTMRTEDAGPNLAIAKLSVVVPGAAGSAANLTVLVALGLLVGHGAFVTRTPWGRVLPLVRGNAEACSRSGIASTRYVAWALLASGACMGLASVNTVLGGKGYFEVGLGAGSGIAGLAVALLGRGSTVGIGLSALLLATLSHAGFVVNALVPLEAMDLCQAVLLVALALADRHLRREPVAS
jgi:simple sugar transport system permease protein